MPPELLYREADDISHADDLVVSEDGSSTLYMADGTIIHSRKPAQAASPAGPAKEEAPATAGEASGGKQRTGPEGDEGKKAEEQQQELRGGGASSSSNVFRVPGGSGWRVRGVDETGEAIDRRQQGRFQALRARVSFDVWCAAISTSASCFFWFTCEL